WYPRILEAGNTRLCQKRLRLADRALSRSEGSGSSREAAKSLALDATRALSHPAEIPRNIEQQRVNDERQRTQRRRSGRVCAGRWRVVHSLTRKRAEVQILLRPQLFWLLRGQVWLLMPPP